MQHRGRVFTTALARHHGIPDSRLKLAMREGTCHRQAPGLYSLDREMDASSRIWAGLLIVGPQATLGGEAARFVRGDGAEPAVIDLWTGHRCLTDRGPWRFHRGTSPDVPPQGDDRTDAEFARLATSRRGAATTALERAQRLLSLAQRERFLAVAESDVTPGRSFLEARFTSDVARRHALVEPHWTPTDDGTGPVLEARLQGDAVRIILDPRHELSPRWADAWGTSSSVDGYRTEISVTFRFDDITMRPCATARRFHEVVQATGVPSLLEPCLACASFSGRPHLTLLGSGGGTW